MDIDLLLPDVLRKLENLVRTGTIAEVRHELPGALVRVPTGKNVTDWRPYHELRAGNTSTWNPPTVGEQVTLLSPGGDLAGALVIGGIHQNDHPALSTDPNKTVTDRITVHCTTHHARRFQRLRRIGRARRAERGLHEHPAALHARNRDHQHRAGRHRRAQRAHQPARPYPRQGAGRHRPVRPAASMSVSASAAQANRLRFIAAKV